MVLELISQLQERVIKPKGIENPNEEWKVTLQLLQIICHSGPASQTLQDAMRIGRTGVFEEYLSGDDAVEEDILTNDETAFCDHIEQIWDMADVHEDVDVNDADEYTAFLYKEYKRFFWNHLHSIIFGADAYRAYKQQKDYLLHKIVKPFGVPVEAAFRRIEVITRYMEYYPPPSGRGSEATQDQWDSYSETKKISASVKKEMKYNLLPETFHDRFDELENDWTEMSHSKFLSEAQKFETLDAKERLKIEKRKEIAKRKTNKEDDSVSTLSRSQKDYNAKGKKRKTGNGPTNAGKARLCELCKAAGAPDFVYTSHNADQCNKKGEYIRKLSGGLPSRSKATRDLRSKEDYRKREVKLVNKIKKLRKKVKQTNRVKDDMDDSSISSHDTNVSF